MTGKEEIGTVRLNSPDSEAAILGAIIKDNKVFYEVQSNLNEAYFYSKVHEKIYKTIRTLISREKSFDKSILQERLQSLNMLEDIGGTQYLEKVLKLACWKKAAPQHAEIIRDLFLKREAINITDKYSGILNNPYNETSSKILLADYISDINSTLTINSESAGLISTEDCVYDLFEGKTGRTILTGIKEIDEKYPIKTQEVIMLAGRPSHGKSAIACSLALGAAENGNRTDMYILEMSRQQVMARMVSSIMCENKVKVPYFNIVEKKKRDQLEELERMAIQEFAYRLPDMNINDNSSQTVTDIISTSLSSSRIKDCPDLIIVDYLDLISLSDQDKSERHDQQLGSAVKRLRQFAKDHDCAVIILSQLNREAERTPTGRPNLAHLRNSGEIEQHADKVLFVFKRSKHLNKLKSEMEMSPEEMIEYQEEINRIEIICSKQRMGQTGSFRLYCDMACNFLGKEKLP